MYPCVKFAVPMTNGVVDIRTDQKQEATYLMAQLAEYVSAIL